MASLPMELAFTLPSKGRPTTVKHGHLQQGEVRHSYTIWAKPTPQLQILSPGTHWGTTKPGYNWKGVKESCTRSRSWTISRPSRNETNPR